MWTWHFDITLLLTFRPQLRPILYYQTRTESGLDILRHAGSDPQLCGRSTLLAMPGLCFQLWPGMRPTDTWVNDTVRLHWHLSVTWSRRTGSGRTHLAVMCQISVAMRCQPRLMASSRSVQLRACAPTECKTSDMFRVRSTRSCRGASCKGSKRVQNT